MGPLCFVRGLTSLRTKIRSLGEPRAKLVRRCALVRIRLMDELRSTGGNRWSVSASLHAARAGVRNNRCGYMTLRDRSPRRAVATPQRPPVVPAAHPAVVSTLQRRLAEVQERAESLSGQLEYAHNVIRLLSNLLRQEAPRFHADFDPVIRRAMSGTSGSVAGRRFRLLDGGVIHGPDTADAAAPRRLIVEVRTDWEMTELTPTVLDSAGSDDMGSDDSPPPTIVHPGAVAVSGGA